MIQISEKSQHRIIIAIMLAGGALFFYGSLWIVYDAVNGLQVIGWLILGVWRYMQGDPGGTAGRLVLMALYHAVTIRQDDLFVFTVDARDAMAAHQQTARKSGRLYPSTPDRQIQDIRVRPGRQNMGRASQRSRDAVRSRSWTQVRCQVHHQD